MIVAIAAQACLPVLNLSLDLYRGWVGVIVYPGEFVIRKTVEDEDGVVHEVEHDASGEAWEGGPVVLSWEDAQMTDGTDAYNVVIHEFAHKIDMLNGEADGHPPLLRRWHAPLDSQAWADVFDHAYDHFCAQVDAVPERRWARFERDSLIDPYAADHPSEFFAVCSEALFVQAAGVRSGISGTVPAARALLPAGPGAASGALHERRLARTRAQRTARQAGKKPAKVVKRLIFWHNRRFSTIGKWLAPRCGPNRSNAAARGLATARLKERP